MSAFDGLPPQPEARRLLEAALRAPGHAYLLAGPSGSAKRRYAHRFAAALLDAGPGRVESHAHPDLFVLEPEGGSILIEQARRLRRDLYLRPFEAARRVYLVLDAHLLRDESANALLKSLEEPPPYGVFVLVSDHAERMLDTIRSRLETVPFRPFSAGQLRELVGDAVAARAALGSLERAQALAADEGTRARRRAYLELARAAHADPDFDPSRAAATVLELTNARGRAESKAVAAELAERLRTVDDEREQRALTRRYEERGRRMARRAEWDELRLATETVGLWYRDLLAASLAEDVPMVNSDLVEALADAADGGQVPQLLAALEAVFETHRSLELNVHPGLAMEALFHRLQRVPSAASGGRGCP
jgi:DNA polymerase-3 subunit delta'